MANMTTRGEDPYKKNRVLLYFKDRSLEKEFRESYLEHTMENTKRALLVGFILYLSSAFLDFPFYHTIRPITMIVIYFIITPMGIVVAFLARHPFFKRIMVPTISIASGAAGLGIIIMMGLARPPINYFTHTSLILIILSIYSVIRIFFVYATFTSILLIVIYEIVALWINPLPFPILMASNFSLISAFILSMLGGYIIEAYARQNFVQLKIIQNDMIELHHLNKELERLATIDPLTKLYNRRFMETKMEEAIALFKRKGIPISFLFLDLDNFKAINDLYGHRFGDGVLQNVARIIRKSLRREDIAFRYGGDEFCILFVNALSQEALKVGRRLLKKIERFAKNNDLNFGISGGCIQLTKDLCSPDDIIKEADKVLYQAKRLGKGKILNIEEVQ